MTSEPNQDEWLEDLRELFTKAFALSPKMGPRPIMLFDTCGTGLVLHYYGTESIEDIQALLDSGFKHPFLDLVIKKHNESISNTIPKEKACDSSQDSR